MNDQTIKLTKVIKLLMNNHIIFDINYIIEYDDVEIVFDSYTILIMNKGRLRINDKKIKMSELRLLLTLLN